MRGSNTGVDLMNYSSENCLYQEGEIVWASYRDKWYEAKVEKVESRTKACLHFVHYLGWNKRWDEWLETERLKKFTEDLKECGKSATVKNTKSGLKNKEKQSADILRTEKNMNIEIPPTLKKQLVDDCEFVTHLGKLVKLPRTPNINDILKKFCAFREKKNNMLSGEIEEILSRLRGYFDKALPAMFLYKGELKQYRALCAEHSPPSTVYGAEHLLRLFVKLPEILDSVKIEEATRMKVQCEILGLLKFLQKNQSTFFLSTYQRIPHFDTENKE